MTTVFCPDLHLWTVSGWILDIGPHGGSFELWASPKFLEAAKRYAEKVDHDRFNTFVHALVKRAGYKSELYEHHRWISFGEWGLMHWNAPGNACGMDWAYDNHRPLKDGAKFYPHNVDNAVQQSLLMATWLHWAHFIEGALWEERQAEKKNIPSEKARA